MEGNQLTNEQKKYIRKYLKRKTYIIFLYLCAAGNQCLIMLLGVIVRHYNPDLSWLSFFANIFGAITLACFIDLIIDYSVEQDAMDDKENN